MCGIFGLLVGNKSGLEAKTVRAALESLFLLSESRGKESSGFAIAEGEWITVFKSAMPAGRLVKGRHYRDILDSALSAACNSQGRLVKPMAFIGHARLVTNGSQAKNENNQPVVADGMVCIHNGIIVNDAELFAAHPEMERQAEVDTEILPRLIRRFREGGLSLCEAARKTFALIQGNASVAVLASDLDELLLATNNGSLYRLQPRFPQASVFASERYILERFMAQRPLAPLFGDAQIRRMSAGDACLVDLETLTAGDFSLTAPLPAPLDRAASVARSVLDLSHTQPPATQEAYNPSMVTRHDRTELLYRHQKYLGSLRRCARCVLPETMPFIAFDEAGVCNYCRTYEPLAPKGQAALEELAAPHRRAPGEPDCLVSLSGGRDSCYGLHYVTKVLGLTPISYTYDWGMVTDIARRNIARMCGRLGVEHILISADIGWKRRNIGKNVRAWLKRPHLGAVPLFMAGDKKYFWYFNQLRKQTGIRLLMYSGNPLEVTRFKAGFAGVRDSVIAGAANEAIGSHRKSLFGDLGDKLNLGRFYVEQFLRNPAYLNTSLLDTAFAYYAYYFTPHDFTNVYNYTPWREDVVDSTLIGQYDWETDPTSPTTWRIGDGTAPFYNYIYHCVAGLTENDTFRSNQIREGMITREEALARIEAENQPRYETIKWYLSVIGLGDEFNEVIERINAIPKLYPTE